MAEKQYRKVRKRKKLQRWKNQLKGRGLFAVLIALMVSITGGIGIIGLHYYTAETYMTMNGQPEMTVGLYGLFEDPGVTAKRGGRDISNKVEVKSSVDTTEPGDYTITYHCGNFTAERKVTVLDHMSPKLKLKGEQLIRMKLGDTFEEPGFTAKADDGTNLNDRVEVSENSFKRAGTYDISYTVTDDEGKTTRVSRRISIAPNTEYVSPGLPICMYHYVYDEENPPDDVNQRYKNYISKQDLIEEMNWLNEEGYYYPTWDEVRDYVDGKLILPDKSIVLTFDDGEMATLDQLLPIVEQTHVPVTSFLITEHAGEKKVRTYKSKYLHFESHTHKMHHAGGVAGYRGMLPVVDVETGLADLQESIRICGSNKAIAYPYGDFNQATHEMVTRAGFRCGVTTQFGNAYPGMDPLTLPRVRMWQDQTLEYFQRNVEPARETSFETQ